MAKLVELGNKYVVLRTAFNKEVKKWLEEVKDEILHYKALIEQTYGHIEEMYDEIAKHVQDEYAGKDMVKLLKDREKIHKIEEDNPFVDLADLHRKVMIIIDECDNGMYNITDFLNKLGRLGYNSMSSGYIDKYLNNVEISLIEAESNEYENRLVQNIRNALRTLCSAIDLRNKGFEKLTRIRVHD